MRAGVDRSSQKIPLWCVLTPTSIHRHYHVCMRKLVETLVAMFILGWVGIGIWFLFDWIF